MSGKVRLGNIIKTAKIEKCGENDLPVLSMTMHNGILLQKDRFKKSLASVDKSNYKIVKKGQLVVGFPIDEGVLYIQNIIDKGIMSPAYNVWNVDTQLVDLQFLEYSLHSPSSMKYYASHLRGTTARRRSLPTETLLALPLTIPDMENQKKVVRNLQKLNDVIELRNKQLEKLDLLVKSRFIEMFGQKNYPLVKASDVCDFITKGTTPKREEIYGTYSNDRIPFLKVYNLSSTGKLLFKDKAQYIDKTIHNSSLSRSIVFPNDVLMNIVGPPLGKFAIVDDSFPEWNINQAIAIFRAKEKIIPLYLMYSLMQDEILTPFLQQAVGIRQLNISLEQCRELQIKLPPLKVQCIFSEFTKKVDKSKLAIQQSLEKLETLKKSLMQEYFG